MRLTLLLSGLVGLTALGCQSTPDGLSRTDAASKAPESAPPVPMPAPQAKKSKRTTMPYLLGTPVPYARALLKRVFKLEPEGPASVEIIQLSDGSKAKLRTRIFKCAPGAQCGYKGFKLLSTAKDNRVVGGLSTFKIDTGSSAIAEDAGKLFRLLAGAKHVDAANAWLSPQIKGGASGGQTFGHARLTVEKTKAGDAWLVTARLP